MNKESQLVFCNKILVKVFDKVAHKRLVPKISQSGLGGVVQNWIQEWVKEKRVCSITW